MEETIPLNSHRHELIESYPSLMKSVQTLTRTGSDDPSMLHVASCTRQNETIQVILTNNAVEAFSPHENLNALLTDAWKLFHSDVDVHDYDYIQSSLNAADLLAKRCAFREQIDVYRTYDNRHPHVTKLLLEIIDYYLHEYLVVHERFSPMKTATLDSLFRQAIVEQNYLKYFIRAYTHTNSFHHALNKHLALYILDYFDLSTYSSSPTNYRLINCLVHIVTLIINHPDVRRLQYRGRTYRGVLMTENDLQHYTTGKYILNHSFVSTSKQRSVAQMFASGSTARMPVLFTYAIKRAQTAIDIEHLSSVGDEKEVLILPFAVFQVKDRIDNDRSLSPPVLVEIDLEECEEEQTLKRRADRSPSDKRTNTMRMRSVGFGLLVLLAAACLLFAVRFSRSRTFTLAVTCPKIMPRSAWNATDATKVTELSTPVSFVGIHHTTGKQCHSLDACAARVQSMQHSHMNKTVEPWSDIGYNFVVGSTGDIFEGRGWNATGAHCRNYNAESIGIGIIGDYERHSLPALVVGAVGSLIECGIVSGFIERSYAFVGHGNYNVMAKLPAELKQSDRRREYCGLRGKSPAL